MIGFLRDNINNSRRCIDEKYWMESYQAVRWTLCNLLDGLAWSCSGIESNFGPRNHLAKYWGEYRIIEFGDYPVWNQEEWKKLANEQNQDLSDFANLSPNDFPIREINHVLKHEFIVQEQVNRIIREYHNSTFMPYSNKTPGDLSGISEKQIWAQLLTEDDSFSLLKSWYGLVCLLDMVEKHVEKGLSEGRITI